MQITNLLGSPLNSFVISIRLDSSAPWVSIAWEANDYIAPVFGDFIAFCNGDPTTLKDGESIIIGIDGLCMAAELQVTASSVNSTVIEMFDYKNEATSPLSKVYKTFI